MFDYVWDNMQYEKNMQLRSVLCDYLNVYNWIDNPRPAW